MGVKEALALIEREEAQAALTCPLQPYQSVGERSRGLQVN